MVRGPCADDSDVARAETVERPTPRPTSRRRRLLRAAITIVFLTVLLVPPFTPPVPWRSVTDQVPWQVVDRVPWSPYPRTTVEAVNPDTVCPANPVEFVAFGHRWQGPPTSRSELGTFRQVDRTHGVFNGHSFSVAPGFNDLNCSIS